MCGIAGAISLSSAKQETQNVEKMLSSIAHRGPDNADVRQISDKVFLGHARLSILDLSAAANQPMSIGEKWLTYNGEVYNFKELSKELASDNQPKSSGDTEVLLRLLAANGLDALDKLDGFYAFGFYDGDDFYLVRDRFGQKPLYYTVDNQVLYFASELKAFNAIGIKLEVNEEVLQQTLSYRFSADFSPYSNIKLLGPGTYLKVKPGSTNIELVNYYDLRDKIKNSELNPLGFNSNKFFIDAVEELFCKAVKKRLVADVPVGVICSGGLDSSLIAWAASQFAKTTLFHVDVVENSERKYAELLASKLGCELKVVSFTRDKFKEYEEKSNKNFEYPAVHPNNAGILAVAELARNNGFPVLLGGEAADELFGGYMHHRHFYWLALLGKIFGKSIEQILSRSKFPAARMKKYSITTSIAYDEELENEILKWQSLLEKDFSKSDLRYLAFINSEIYSYLQPLLLRADKMGMLYGVELRLPFLDRELVEYAFRLPARLRYDKKILRQIARRHLPTEIVKRPKAGFALPESFFSEKGEYEQEFIRNSFRYLQAGL